MPTTRWMTYQDLPWAYADSGACRVCGCERKEGERWQTFCKNDGGACLRWYKIRSDPGYARRAVERRDKGVCGLCGLDTRELKQRVFALDQARKNGDPWQPVMQLLEAHGFKPHPRYDMAGFIQWEADHTVPVVEGGGMCGLEGLRTLCLPCHHQETAALAARRAERRRPNSGPLFEESA